MTSMPDQTIDTPVRKSITVKAAVEEAFTLFTDGIDSWWPRSHHIGKSPMKRAVLQGRAGGRCYSEQVDGTECDWGTILVWEPPRRFVLAWQITGEWQYQPDLAASSEVDVRFTPEPNGSTRIDLEHRHLGRHGSGAQAMRKAIDAPDGWTGILQLYADRVGKEKSGGAG
jgi:uncharacterized protein YndB with AHSA1/START domain